MAFFWALVSDWDLKKLSERNVIRVRSKMDGHELIELQNGAAVIENLHFTTS